MNTFDDAKAATEAMFSQTSLDTAADQAADNGIVGDAGGEAGDASAITAAQQQNTQQADAANNEGATANTNSTVPAAQEQPQAVPQPDNSAELQNEIAQLRQQMAQMQQQNNQLQDLINQQSQVQQETVEEAVMPQFDFTQAMYADENTQKRFSNDYANNMLNFVMNKIKGDMKPVLDEYNAAQRDRETRAIINTYKNAPEFAEMERLLPQMQYIMNQNPGMFNESIPLNERLVMAYAAARGANAPIGEHKYTVDELMGLYDGNSEFRDAIEQRRIAAVKNGQQVPPVAASSGVANVALNIQDKPKNMDDAKKATLAMLGLN